MKELIDNDRTLIKLWIYEIRERLVSDFVVSNRTEMLLEDYDRGVVVKLRSRLEGHNVVNSIPDSLIRAYKTNKDILLEEIEDLLKETEDLLSAFDEAESRALNGKDIRGGRNELRINDGISRKTD